ncbi:MAG: DUF86 domain-containing protein [Sphingobium sp.]|uniref:HepT-like ribonuclease domain-containing protein n=1 Tax=Sphingobium sp. TaxID=1912891 RepID=UPI0029AF6F5D|nr:DUF86 domain-containing protein [Sphingobium sp.]MDX3911283.1 DUF86 domain-containing protein [Sphingobium sp.]
MKPERAGEYVGHMIAAIDRIATYLDGLDRETFLHSPMAQDAVIRNFEIIGEAARNVERHAPDIVAANPEIPWRYAKGMRNHLMHGYFNVDLEAVWATAQNDLPAMRAQLVTIVEAQR